VSAVAITSFVLFKISPFYGDGFSSPLVEDLTLPLSPA
jgi:hypothetical protein